MTWKWWILHYRILCFLCIECPDLHPLQYMVHPYHSMSLFLCDGDSPLIVVEVVDGGGLVGEEGFSLSMPELSSKWFFLHTSVHFLFSMSVYQWEIKVSFCFLFPMDIWEIKVSFCFSCLWIKLYNATLKWIEFQHYLHPKKNAFHPSYFHIGFKDNIPYLFSRLVIQ